MLPQLSTSYERASASDIRNYNNQVEDLANYLVAVRAVGTVVILAILWFLSSVYVWFDPELTERWQRSFVINEGRYLLVGEESAVCLESNGFFALRGDSGSIVESSYKPVHVQCGGGDQEFSLLVSSGDRWSMIEGGAMVSRKALIASDSTWGPLGARRSDALGNVFMFYLLGGLLVLMIVTIYTGATVTRKKLPPKNKVV